MVQSLIISHNTFVNLPQNNGCDLNIFMYPCRRRLVYIVNIFSISINANLSLCFSAFLTHLAIIAARSERNGSD